MAAPPESAREFLSRLIDRARRLKKTIVFPEGEDPRVIAAAGRLAADGVVKPVLLGRPPSNARAGITFVEPAESKLISRYAAYYQERRRAKGITWTEAQSIAKDPLYFAALMVGLGYADASLGGAVRSTRDTLRAAFQCIGLHPGGQTVSGVSLMAVQNRSRGANGLFAFADCVVVIEPTPVQLAEIAIATARTSGALLDTEPAVALLSFSTRGTARHKEVDRVIEALRIIRARAPELNVDGEMQVDAAVDAVAGASKAPGSTVAGRANTLIFPNLASANIGYKLVERLGDAMSIGPFLQGLAKPANDMSRACTAESIYHAAAVTAIQCEMT